jgi:hypothetical protein
MKVIDVTTIQDRDEARTASEMLKQYAEIVSALDSEDMLAPLPLALSDMSKSNDNKRFPAIESTGYYQYTGRTMENLNSIQNVLLFGSLYIAHSTVLSLEGAPSYISMSFKLNNCQGLRDLRGGPLVVRGDLDLQSLHSLTSLEGSPEIVGGDFLLHKLDSLESLEGMPKLILGDLHISDCDALDDKYYLEEEIEKLCRVVGVIIVNERPW